MQSIIRSDAPPFAAWHLPGNPAPRRSRCALSGLPPGPQLVVRENRMCQMGVIDLERLQRFADLFRDCFRRRDQLRWAGVYLHGLLTAADRKTIGSIARQATLPPETEVGDVAQALQNFVNQSPWDENEVWRRYRAMLQPRFEDPDGTFIVDDLPFLKQGNHSVGVHRQYCSALQGKANCQVAVGVHYAGSGGVVPLALRLYLPRAWLASLPRLEAACVPETHRGPQTRTSIALELLTQLQKERWHARKVLVTAGAGNDPEYEAALHRLGLTLVSPADMQATQTAVKELRRILFDELGLDHFEGRSWRGFHHHSCLVMLAHAYRSL